MGDVRFATHLRRIQESPDPSRALREMRDESVVSALAAASREQDPYWANVLATEAMNRMRRNATLVDLAEEGLLAVDAEGRLTHANPAAEELLGWDRAEVVGQDVHAVVHPHDHHDGEVCPLRQVLIEGRTVRMQEDAFARKDGLLVPVSLAGSPVMRDGDVLGAVVAFRDVRPQKAAEARLHALRAEADGQARTLDAILEGTPDLVYVLDEELRCVHVGRAAAQLVGLTPAQLAGRAWRDMGLPESTMGPLAARFQETLRTGRPSRTLFRFPEPTSEKVYEAVAAPLAIEAGSRARLVVITRDVTERQAQAAALRASTERVVGILESITDAFYALDRDWRFTYLNREAERVLRRGNDELLGKSLWEEFPEARGTEFDRGYHQAVETGTPVHFETFYAPLGRWFEAHAYPSPGGGLSVYFRDVTARHEMMEEVRTVNAELEERVQRRTRELAQANRELESFSYSVSHDLRGPLRGIDYFAEILEDEHGASLDAEGREHLRRLRAEARRLGEHIQGLLEVSRASLGPLERRPVDLSALAGEIVAALRRSDPSRDVRFDVQPGLVAEAEPRLARSVLENLLGNAWKFTSRTAHAAVSFSASRDGDGRLVYTVRDNGAGFDMTRVASLFRSFERLHASSEFEGTGVGLATVKRIVERHGGRVWAEGEPGRGAAFHFTLG